MILCCPGPVAEVILLPPWNSKRLELDLLLEAVQVLNQEATAHQKVMALNQAAVALLGVVLKQVAKALLEVGMIVAALLAVQPEAHQESQVVVLRGLLVVGAR